MKLDNHKKSDRDKVELQQVQHMKRLVLHQTLKPKENHKVWEYNTNTGELKLAEFSKEGTITWKDTVNKNFRNIKKEILKKEWCIYFSSLNEKNAKKILRRDYGVNI